MPIKYAGRRFHRSGWIPVAVIFLAALAAGCSGNGEQGEVKRPVVAGLTIAAVAPSRVDDVYETTGTVRSERTSLVASRAMGTVTSLLVREGDSVKAGQLLLTIDDRDAAQRVQAASKAVDAAAQNKTMADTTWQRYRNLYKEKALSQQEMDQIETQKKIAEAEYERAKAMAAEAETGRSFTRVRATVSGRVTEKRVDVGSMANPGVPLLVIEGGGYTYVESVADEGLSGRVKQGMPVEVVLADVNRKYSGAVREVLPAIDPLSRTFIIKTGIKDFQARSGLFARVRIVLGSRDGLLVSEKAVVRKGQLTGVYAVDNQGVITYRLVRTGAVHPGGIEILSGLNPGDRIVTGGVESAVDGGIVAPAGAGGAAK
jgi:RND family efflux transporter MFP subunit